MKRRRFVILAVIGLIAVASSLWAVAALPRWEAAGEGTAVVPSVMEAQSAEAVGAGSPGTTGLTISAAGNARANHSAEGGTAEPEKPAGKAGSGDKPEPAPEPVEKRIVPVISLGDGARIGAVQISGPRSFARQVKAVVMLEGDYKDIVRYRALIPIKTEKVVEKIERVPFVAVTGIVDLKVS